jgi:hypothetical protein
MTKKLTKSLLIFLVVWNTLLTAGVFFVVIQKVSYGQVMALCKELDNVMADVNGRLSALEEGKRKD